jgi:hypothetical protein
VYIKPLIKRFLAIGRIVEHEKLAKLDFALNSHADDVDDANFLPLKTFPFRRFF